MSFVIPGRRSRTAGIAIAALMFLPVSAATHGVEIDITQRDATVIRIYHADGTPFAGETFQLFAPGDDEPFLTGITDPNGTIAFSPDRAGEWRVRAFSKDGHGVTTRFAVGTDGVVDTVTARTAGSHGAKLMLGVGVILAVFGVGAMVSRRRAS